MSSSNEEQVGIAARLQSKLLHHFEKLLTEGTATSTDLATIARMLIANGWSFDPARMPRQLKDLMTTRVPLKLLDFNDEPDEPKRELPPSLGYDPDAQESL
jgi:hypothetical protein